MLTFDKQWLSGYVGCPAMGTGDPWCIHFGHRRLHVARLIRHASITTKNNATTITTSFLTEVVGLDELQPAVDGVPRMASRSRSQVPLPPVSTV